MRAPRTENGTGDRERYPLEGDCDLLPKETTFAEGSLERRPLSGENHPMFVRFVAAALLASIALPPSAIAAEAPYRIAVVIGDQWKDPSSQLIRKTVAAGKFSGSGAAPEVFDPVDFFHVAVLLKSWALPFDVIRLDQQLLDERMFLDADDRPKYGAIVWLVPNGAQLWHPDFRIVREVVERHGIGLVALADRIGQAPVAALLGVKLQGSWEAEPDEIVVTNAAHPVTRGLGPSLSSSAYVPSPRRVQVSLAGASAIARQGRYPYATARELPGGARAVWIGGDADKMFVHPKVRVLFRRALGWTLGFTLQKTWASTAIMRMDDFGNAQNVWLAHWHHPTLTEDQIERHLIAPLRANHAVLNIMLVPGFVNDGARRLEPAFRRSFVDARGTKQDYVSTKRGLDKGVAAGVFAIQSHGLTHMQPDLVAPPTWYGSPLDRERAEVGWYREFGDMRRGQEIPAAEQLWRMRTSRDWIRRLFGVTPQWFDGGGRGTSISYDNDTNRLAAAAGFGWSDGYAGPDFVFGGWAFEGTDESPLRLAAPPDGHDRGITRAPEKFAAVFAAHPGVRFIDASEHVGYLHAHVNGRCDRRTGTLHAEISYDEPYGSYFATHASQWTLALPEARAGARVHVSIDGGPEHLDAAQDAGLTIALPHGLGPHRVDARVER